MKNLKLILYSVFLIILITGCSNLENIQETDKEIIEEDYIIEILYNDLRGPWGISFIDNNEMLITEKNGNLLLVNLEKNTKFEIENIPEVDPSGQGGLLDVEYYENYVYITYSARNGDGSATHLGKGYLNIENNRLDDFKVLHIAEPFMHSGAHYGSRVIIKDDYVFYSTGDRGQKNLGYDHVSQDKSNYLGTTIRLYKNGTIPEDNPFVNNPNVLNGIYTYGHRNIQGMTLNPITNEIWTSEHGERDGDEINVLISGENYGWPIAHYGCRYGTDNLVAKDLYEIENVIHPKFYWECGSGGFPPAGMTFYYGNKFEDWQGNLFVGGLASQYLARFIVNENEIIETDGLFKDKSWRIRDVQESPDGYLYVLVDDNPGKLIKIKPN